MEEACKLPEGEQAPDNTPYCLGIDEAGRGAMLGHMTYGVAWCPVDKKEELATMGFMGAPTAICAIRSFSLSSARLTCAAWCGFTCRLEDVERQKSDRAAQDHG